MLIVVRLRVLRRGRDRHGMGSRRRHSNPSRSTPHPSPGRAGNVSGLGVAPVGGPALYSVLILRRKSRSRFI